MTGHLAHGFPTVLGRGLLGEFRNFANPPVLVVTMPDLWGLFARHFEGCDHRVHFTTSIERADLDREAMALTDVGSVVGLGGGQALDAAKWFAWRRGLPLFQAPTALSVNAVYSHRSGVRDGGRVRYLGWAVPECVFMDYDVLRAAPPRLNWSGIGDVLCFHTGVLDWAYARDRGRGDPRWPWDEGLAAQSLAKVDRIVEAAEDIRALTDRGIEALVDGLKWGTSFHGAGWCPAHIEGTDHFLFYALERRTGRRFLHGQPVGLGVVLGSLLHDSGADRMIEAIATVGLDVRPPAMGVTWEEAEDALLSLRDFVRSEPLWHSIAHDERVTPALVRTLRARLDRAYGAA